MARNAKIFSKFIFLLLVISSIGHTTYPIYKFSTCVEPSLSFLDKAMVFFGVKEKPRVCQTLESFLLEMARTLLLHLIYLVVVFQYRKTGAGKCDNASTEERERIREFKNVQETFRNHEMEVFRNALPFKNNHVIAIDGADALIPVMCVEPEELLKPEEWVNYEI